MNVQRVKGAAMEIERLQLALTWLKEHGSKLRTHGPEEDFSLVFTPRLASGCPGAVGAANMISAYARLSIMDLIASSILNCENAIQLELSVIRSEYEKPELE